MYNALIACLSPYSLQLIVLQAGGRRNVGPVAQPPAWRPVTHSVAVGHVGPAVGPVDWPPVRTGERDWRRGVGEGVAGWASVAELARDRREGCPKEVFHVEEVRRDGTRAARRP